MLFLTKMDKKNTDNGYANMKKCIILVYIFYIPEQYFEIIEINMTIRILKIGFNLFQFLLIMICIKILSTKHR